MKKRFIYYLYLLPTFVLLVPLFYYPFSLAIRNAFFSFSGSVPRFVGLQQFHTFLFEDPQTIPALENITIMTAFGLLVGIGMAFIVAELIFSLKSAFWQHFFETGFLISSLVPGVVILLIWSQLFNPSYGFINSFLQILGINTSNILWLGSPKTALLSLLLIGFPWIGGPTVLIILAGLQNIPKDLIDYAKLEGLKGIKKIFMMDFPLVTGQIRVIFLTALSSMIPAFTMQLVLTGGGPGYSTSVPGWQMFQAAFSFDEFGYASAIGVVIGITILVITLIGFRYLKIVKV
ncbi:MAG: carbohydrate ABC transporter permease [Caldisphaera sp.]